ncbi:MAG: cytochrome c biogenesis protein CcdA [Eubacteriales bacterium]|nr:cytochrome c biogenesis protein CcdA [Eubacteriales bacterium]
MQYLILFLEGIITFLSPCLLPMLPIYVSYFAGGEQATTGKTLKNALGFVAGFTLVFMVLGLFAGTVGGLLARYQTVVNVVLGAVVVALGLSFLGLFQLPFFRGYSGGFSPKNLGFFTSVVFGAVFSVSWTPCVGAFLGSALMMASQQGVALQGALMLLCYALGLALPFVLSALLIGRLKGAFAFIQRHYRVVNWVSGALLVAVGILMMTGTLGRFLTLLS